MSAKDTDETKVIYLDKDYKAEDKKEEEEAPIDDAATTEKEAAVADDDALETKADVEADAEADAVNEDDSESNDSVATNELISLHPLYIMLDTFLKHEDKSIAEMFAEMAVDIKELKNEFRSLRSELTAVPPAPSKRDE